MPCGSHVVGFLKPVTWHGFWVHRQMAKRLDSSTRKQVVQVLGKATMALRLDMTLAV